uniref:Knl1 C-terminal RWD domain-containing protein n=1 Tax=Neogobius melanostomus TaxID=47308 RepID=A0A8C6SYN5_9GOBI
MNEKTIVFSDDGFMDITRNWTSNIEVVPSVSSTLDKSLKERKGITPGLSVRLSEKQERVQRQEIGLQRGSIYKGQETSIHQIMIDPEEEDKEKTVRFSTNDACMDVTSCHTVKISADLPLQPDLDSLNGEKTVRFTTNDAGMDITQCVTVNIARDLVPDSPVLQNQESSGGPQPATNVDLDFENFFASLSDQNIKVKKSQNNPNKPFMKNQSNTQTMLSMNDSKITRAPNESAETCLDESNVNMENTKAKKCHDVSQAGIISQPRRSKLGIYKGIEVSRRSETQRNPVKFDAKDICRERTVQFAADDVLMNVTSSHAVHTSTDPNPYLPFSERTMRFDAAMDTTQCHTVNITNDFEPSSLLPKYGEKTVKFSADNATMDVTSSHTVHISTDLKPDLTLSEKTVQFDAAMDTTQCHTVNIANNFEPSLPKSAARYNADNTTKYETKSVGLKEHRNMFPISGEKTLRFNIDDANMDVTKSHTMMIAVEPQLISNLGVLPGNEEKTVQFSSEDGGMEVTQCLTSNIGFEMEATRTDLSPLPASITMDCPALKKREPFIYTNRRCRSSFGHGSNSALKVRRSVPWGSQAATSAFGTVNGNINAAQSQADSKGDLNCEMDSFEMPKAGVVNENIGFMSVIEEKSMAEISQKDDCQENREVNITEVLPVQIQRQAISEEAHPGSVVTDSTSSAEEGSNDKIMPKRDVKINVTSEVNNKNVGEVEENIECAPPSMENGSGVAHSQKSRRRSLANIQSKIRRISQMLSDPPDNVAMDGNPLIPSLDLEPKAEVPESWSVPKDEPDASVDTEKDENKLDDAQEEPLHAPTTPYRLETKQLMSQLSVVGCKPKLPRRSKCEEAKAPDRCLAQAACNSIKTQNIQAQVANFDLNVSDINDEELGSYEDVSETLDKNDMDKEPEMITLFHEFELDQELQDEVFEDEFALVNERKRSLPYEQNLTQDEKRVKTCNEAIILDSQTCTLEGDNIVAVSTQTADSSNCSQTASLRCEATFESSSKQSLFESQLEDYVSDIQRKFDDGTVTMAEFFKLFHIDFVIHNPRQSMVSGRTLSDTESTLLDLSHDRHISIPKQLVYEANVRNLTEQVEGFKVRLRDLDKPLTLVNRTLWEEMEHFSESEFKSFGAKLKEKHSLYRKMSKAQSHEMKGLLYSDLIQTNVDEQKKLSGSIEKADAMLKNLDDCIAELEANLATVEDDVKSHQEELNKVTDALANNEKATSELEILKKQNENKVRRVKDETKNLERHLDMLHMLNEWKLVEIRTNSVIYTFLHETLHLVLVYEQSKENTEGKIADISFKHLLDERSQCHARLVHTLVSQFTQEKKLTKKYSTSTHVPQLLHDISLVVSRCRQLGEDLRRLKTWAVCSLTSWTSTVCTLTCTSSLAV